MDVVIEVFIFSQEMILHNQMPGKQQIIVLGKKQLSEHIYFVTGIFQRQSLLAQITMTSDLAVSLLLPAWSLSIKRK